MDRRHEAACLDEDPELFFPIGNTGPALPQIEEASRSAGDVMSETHAGSGRWKQGKTTGPGWPERRRTSGAQAQGRPVRIRTA